jgi:hypothetical protein
MSDPAVAVVAAAYDHPALVPPQSDRLLDLVETPLGAMTLLAGLRRQRDGGPLALLVRPLRVAFFSSAHLVSAIVFLLQMCHPPLPMSSCAFSYRQLPATVVPRIMRAIELHLWPLEVRPLYLHRVVCFMICVRPRGKVITSIYIVQGKIFCFAKKIFLFVFNFFFFVFFYFFFFYFFFYFFFFFFFFFFVFFFFVPLLFFFFFFFFPLLFLLLPPFLFCRCFFLSFSSSSPCFVLFLLFLLLALFLFFLIFFCSHFLCLSSVLCF